MAINFVRYENVGVTNPSYKEHISNLNTKNKKSSNQYDV
jgi:hypothetical protein